MGNAEVGMRPPASPSCRLYLRAGSRKGHRAYAPEGRRNKKGRGDGGMGGVGEGETGNAASGLSEL